MSEIEFPELLPVEFNIADVTIRIGTTCKQLNGDSILQKPFSSISKDEYLLNVKNICKYYAGFGREIIIEPAHGIDKRSINLFLLGTVMAAILYQRKHIPIHASAIIRNERLILFSGNSGAGKSTLLAQLTAKGYTAFTDDICVLRYTPSENKEVLGSASYPIIKLWDDAITQLDLPAYSRDFKIRPQLPKYGNFFHSTFNTASLPVDKIFILKLSKTITDINVKQLEPLKAFSQMEKHAYRRKFIANPELRTLHFSLLSQLIRDIPVFEVSRPEAGSNVEQLSEAIDEFL
jgi:hypothetical protein